MRDGYNNICDEESIKQICLNCKLRSHEPFSFSAGPEIDGTLDRGVRGLHGKLVRDMSTYVGNFGPRLRGLMGFSGVCANFVGKLDWSGLVVIN